MKVAVRKKKKANGDYSLYLDYYNKGTRKYEFLGLYLTKDKKDNKRVLQLAENIKAQRQIELQNHTYGFIPDFKRKANFLKYYESISIQKTTNINCYKSTLMYLKEFTGGQVSISAIDEDWLERFKKFLTNKLSQNTAATYFSTIKTVFRQAVRDKIIIDNPANNVTNVKKQESKRAYLTIEEIEKLAKTECSRADLKRAFLFSCFTGLRYGDVVRLKWEDIKNDRIDIIQQKTKGVEYLPLNETSKNLLKTEKGNIIPLPTNYVFSIPKKVHTNVILKVWGKNAGIKKHLTYHVSRHTFATMSLTLGVDLYTVSKLLGHKQISATQVYAKIIDKKKEEAINSLPNILIS